MPAAQLHSPVSRSTLVALALGALVPLALVAFVPVAFLASGCGGSTSSSITPGSITLDPPTGTVIAATAGPLPQGASPFSQTFTVTNGGTPPFTFVATQTPPGLALAAATPQQGLTGTLSAILSGTPSTPGLEPFTMTITDARQAQYFASWTIEVAPAVPSLTVTPTTLPAGTRGQPYSVYLQASNGVLPFNWTVSTGPLPPGITTTPSTGSSFQISGTPTTAGTFPFTIKVGDSSTPGRGAVVSLSLTVP